VAAAAGLAAAAAVVATAGDSAPAKPAAAGCTVFKGAPPLVLQLPGNRQVTGNAAILAAAEHTLAPGDARILVGRAVNAYPTAGAGDVLRRLRALDQTQPVVRLAEGLVELWSGQCRQAQTALQRVRTADMWGFYGTIADNTLHTSQRPGYPLYLPPPGTPSGSPQHLAALVHAHPGQAGPWLGLAYIEQATDHRAALAAARRAETADPTDPSPQVAVAVLGYDKDHPATSIGTLGTLLSHRADTPEVRFHLGELLYWFGDPTDAAAQWRQVHDDAPASTYGQAAARLLRTIS